MVRSRCSARRGAGCAGVDIVFFEKGNGRRGHYPCFFAPACYFVGMFIKHVAAKKYTLKLREPFSYHTLTLDSLWYVLITATSSTGVVGIGEAALAWDVTGETQEGALAAAALAAPFIAGAHIDSVADVKNIITAIEATIANNTGLKAGIESALLDILGQTKKLPIYKLLGGSAKPFIILQKTFSFQETRRDVASVIQAAIGQGVNVFKFKVGGRQAEEVKILRKIYKRFPEIDIVLDANQAWSSPRAALTFLSALKDVKLKWLEQPLASQDYDGLAALRRQTSVPIMADESCHNVHDLKLLHEKQAIDLVNIKLAKCGGLFAACAMIDYCEKNGIGCMLGDMLHSAVGTAYNLQAACLGKFISYDLTLPERLQSDKSRGLIFEGFKAYIPTQSGLGVTR